MFFEIKKEKETHIELVEKSLRISKKLEGEREREKLFNKIWNWRGGMKN